MNESALGKIIITNHPEIELIASLKSKHNLSYLLACVLINRNIKFEEVDLQFQSNLKHTWISPKLLPDIEQGTQLIINAIEKKLKIGILADYDVDGITSATIWNNFFKKFEIEPIVWIPNREDGYGPCENARKFFQEAKIELLITLDCGSSSEEFFENYDIPAVIIDHHATMKDLKKCVINPNKFEAQTHTELKKLCTAGLSILVIANILKEMKFSNEEINNIITSKMDLAALATICDIMPLTPLNKTFVKLGLEELTKQKRVGLKYIIQNSNIKFPLTAQDIAFVIGPRLNAAGRVESSFLAYELVNTKNEQTAIELNDKIERANNLRRSIQEKVFNEALELAKRKNERILCLANENWHAGVVGIVAAKLQNHFHKTTIVGNITNGIIRASARSNNINIGNLIQQAVQEGIIDSGGGHFNAGGLVCKVEKWLIFENWINNQVAHLEEIKPIIKIDAVVTFKQIEDDYKKLAPFGNGNEEISLMVPNLYIRNILQMQKCIKIILEEDFEQYTFFIPNNKVNLIKSINEIYSKQKKINAIITLSEKNFHNLEDFQII